MKQFFISVSGLDARGVGPQIMIITAPLLLAAIVLEIQSVPFADIYFLKNNIAKTFGWFWLVVGMAAFITTMVQFIAYFPKGKLITNGMYACSRNPIYVSWSVFILPAAGMIFSNWIFFASAFVMFVSTVFFVKNEEDELLECFGKQYFDYKNQVGRIICFIRI